MLSKWIWLENNYGLRYSGVGWPPVCLIPSINDKLIRSNNHKHQNQAHWIGAYMCFSFYRSPHSHALTSLSSLVLQHSDLLLRVDSYILKMFRDFACFNTSCSSLPHPNEWNESMFFVAEIKQRCPILYTVGSTMFDSFKLPDMPMIAWFHGFSSQHTRALLAYQ